MAQTLRKIFQRIKIRRIKNNFRNMDYLEAYAAQTDALTEYDAALAIGGKWEELGMLQYEFLVAEGLSPKSRMLDIGCGTLRGGRHFIRYLEPGHYYGIDISASAIEAAHRLIRHKALEEKKPDLRVNQSKNLRFDQYAGEIFDFILAQSVFSHLQPPHIEEVFANVSKVMYDTSKFYFTYHPGEAFKQRDETNFEYPFSFFQELAAKYGHSVQDVSERYLHPRNQKMVLFTRNRP